MYSLSKKVVVKYGQFGGVVVEIKENWKRPENGRKHENMGGKHEAKGKIEPQATFWRLFRIYANLLKRFFSKHTDFY